MGQAVIYVNVHDDQPPIVVDQPASTDLGVERTRCHNIAINGPCQVLSSPQGFRPKGSDHHIRAWIETTADLELT